MYINSIIYSAGLVHISAMFVYLMLLFFFAGLNVSCQIDPTTKQLTTFVQLLNVDTCSRVGPVIPIRLSTSLNSSITLFSDGTSETVGSISVEPLPCSDNHTQAYILSVPFSGIYTITADIPHGLLPKTCILVNNCSTSFVDQLCCVN